MPTQAFLILVSLPLVPRPGAIRVLGEDSEMEDEDRGYITEGEAV